VDKDTVLLSAFVAVESAYGYSAFLPSIFTIRTFAAQPETKRSIRDGEIIGLFFSLGLAFVVSKMIGNCLPLLFAAGTSILMVGVYEYALSSSKSANSVGV
jgi:hypothetical protein